jgi:cytochrome c553
VGAALRRLHFFICSLQGGENMRRAIAALTLTFGLAIPALAQSFEERLSVCLACHGEKGISETAEVPSLAGMPAKFTLIQLYLFRERMRKI